MSIGVGIACSNWDITVAYNFKKQVAALLASEHNATITWIGKVLSFVNIQVMSTEIKKIAIYWFVDGLSDGEAVIKGC